MDYGLIGSSSYECKKRHLKFYIGLVKAASPQNRRFTILWHVVFLLLYHVIAILYFCLWVQSNVHSIQHGRNL
jgi:hypothetical protein